MKSFKEYLKRNIDDIDEQYLALLYKIVSQFPRENDKTETSIQIERLATFLQEIKIDPSTIRKPKAIFGSARGLVEIGPNFDDPIEGFDFET